MTGESIGTGDGNTLIFTPVGRYYNQLVFVGGILVPPTNYTYVIAGPVTFLPAAFPFSPTPGAPGVGDPVFIFGDFVPVTATGATNLSTGRDYTATELIASVQQRAQVALAARDFGSAQILRILNEEIDGYLVPFVAKRRLEFWVESATVTTDGSGVGTIPSVAMGGKLRALALLQGGISYPLDQIDLPMAVAPGNQPQTQLPNRYYFMGNNFIMFPPPVGASTVTVYYYRRPSMVVPNSACVQIAGFPGGAAAGNYRIAFSGVLPTAYAAAVLVDVVSNVPNFSLYQTSTAIAATSSSTMDVVGTRAAALAIGDWICLAGTAPVISGCPADLWNLIVQEVALKVAESKGGEGTVRNLAAGLAKAEASAGWTIQQRNDGAMRKLSAFPSDVTGMWPWA